MGRLVITVPYLYSRPCKSSDSSTQLAAATRSNQEDSNSVEIGRGANGNRTGAIAALLMPKTVGYACRRSKPVTRSPDSSFNILNRRALFHSVCFSLGAGAPTLDWRRY